MPVDLSAGVSQRGNSDGGFFNTNVQEALFRKGIYGTDLMELSEHNAAIQQRAAQMQQQNVPSQSEIEQFQRMERITGMVDRGELVPANNFAPSAQMQGNMQNANTNTNNNVSEQDDEFERLFGGNRNQQVQQTNPEEERFKEAFNQLNNAAAIRGINGKDVMGFIQSLRPEDYVEMYSGLMNMRDQQNQMQQQSQPVYQQQHQQGNGIRWNGSNNGYNAAPSIASMSGVRVQESPQFDQFNAFRSELKYLNDY